MSTVVFLGGDSRGDALSGMGRSYKNLFNAQGYDFVEINLLDSATLIPRLINLIDTQKIEFVCAWMAYGASLSGNDANGKSVNLWEGIGAPFLALFGDSPAYFFDRHVVASPNFAALYGFPEHETLRRRLPRINGPIGRFQPLLLDGLDMADLDFKRKASGPLLFLKNGNDPVALWNSWKALKPRPLKALQDIASFLAADLSNEAANQIDDVVLAYFGDRGIDMTGFHKLRMFFIAQLDDYLRRVKSAMIAEALLDFPVQVRGNNWEHVDFTGRRATYVNDAHYGTSSGLIREALGMIDMSPNVGQAPHDRVFRSFGAYTLCLTNQQEFLRRDVPQHQEAVSFRFDREAVQDKVADVLAHPARYVDIGIEVAATYRAAHPPEAAIDHLLETADLVRMNQLREKPPGGQDFFIWPG